MVLYIKQQYAKTLKSLPWLDSSVQAVALQKLDKLSVAIGFPETVTRTYLSQTIKMSLLTRSRTP